MANGESLKPVAPKPTQAQAGLFALWELRMAKDHDNNFIGGELKPGSADTRGWKDILQEIISKNVHTRKNGKVASGRTREHNAIVIFKFMNTLHQHLDMKVKNPYNLGEKHIREVLEFWVREGKAAKTIRNDFSVLLKFYGWMGKFNVGSRLAYYLPNVDPERFKVRAGATHSKSWSANGINVEEKLAEAMLINHRFVLTRRSYPTMKAVVHACFLHPNERRRKGRAGDQCAELRALQDVRH
jgi:hypothetical protein